MKLKKMIKRKDGIKVYSIRREYLRRVIVIMITMAQ